MKKIIITLMLLFSVLGTNAAAEIIYITMQKDITLEVIVEKFDKSKNNMTDCGDGYICMINNKMAWGADGGIPKTTLKKIRVTIKGKTADLDTTGIYNPMVTKESAYRFKIKKYWGNIWRVSGSFSDGAGACHAEWLVGNGGATRILLGDSELLYDSFSTMFK